ncbi:hypothetical protein BGX26_011724, partial [Mortierella sp. AD094]
MKFGLPYPEKREFTFRARELPLSPPNKTFAIPEIMASIVKAVVDTYLNLENAQESIRGLRLVSRDFNQAADPYFAVYLECANHKRRNHEQAFQKTMRVCGRYIRSIDFGYVDDAVDDEVLDTARKFCHNVEGLTLYFQELPNVGVLQSDYLLLFDASYSFCDSIKTLNACMVLDGEEGVANFDADFSTAQEYLTGIETLNIYIRNPFAHHLNSDPELSSEPINWETFQGFFRSFPNLKSFEMVGIHVQWNEMPPAKDIT